MFVCNYDTLRLEVDGHGRNGATLPLNLIVSTIEKKSSGRDLLGSRIRVVIIRYIM